MFVWLLLSGVLDLVTIGLILASGERISLAVVVSFWALLAIIPVSHLDISNRFQIISRDLIELLEYDSNEFGDWYQRQLVDIFCANKLSMWLIVIFANVSCTVVILFLGLPLQSTILNILALISFQLIVFFGGQSVYTLLMELRLLSQIANRSPRPYFYQAKPVALRELLLLYMRSSTYILFVYVAILIMVLTGPYGTPPILIMVLVGVAIFPTVYILYSVYHIHILMVKLKERTLAVIDDEIRRVITKNSKAVIKEHLSSHSSESQPDLDLDYLAKLMDIRDKAEKMKEWPWNFEGRVLFVISFLTSTIQVVTAVRSLF
jgi:hypothetical protein